MFPRCFYPPSCLLNRNILKFDCRRLRPMFMVLSALWFRWWHIEHLYTTNVAPQPLTLFLLPPIHLFLIPPQISFLPCPSHFYKLNNAYIRPKLITRRHISMTKGGQRNSTVDKNLRYAWLIQIWSPTRSSESCQGCPELRVKNNPWPLLDVNPKQTNKVSFV